MMALVIVGLFLASLYAVWRARFGYPGAGATPVLCFHKVTRHFQFEGTWTTPERFAATVDHLRDRGFRFVDEAKYLGSLGPGGGNPREIFLTFDDGYEELLDTAVPVLRERSIPFHVFVVSDFVGRSNDWELSLGRPAHRHASWAGLRAMMAAGATVGSHSATHRDLTRLSPGEVRDELVRSRTDIEDALGATVRTVSYPFGRSNAAVEGAAREAGYDAGFSLYPRHTNARAQRYALRRNGVYIIDPPRWVERKLVRNRWFWIEEMKCRGINAVAVLTPLLTRPGRRPPDPGSAGRSGHDSKGATG